MSNRAGALKELFETLEFRPERIVTSPALRQDVKQHVLSLVNVGGREITLRAHPGLPEDMLILFGGGTFAVIQLEAPQ